MGLIALFAWLREEKKFWYAGIATLSCISLMLLLSSRIMQIWREYPLIVRN